MRSSADHEAEGAGQQKETTISSSVPNEAMLICGSQSPRYSSVAAQELDHR